MNSRKSHYRQVPYHVYYTYIQTSNQANRDKKTNQNDTNNPKTKKLHKNVKIFHKDMRKRVHAPTPKSHNVIIGS